MYQNPKSKISKVCLPLWPAKTMHLDNAKRPSNKWVLSSKLPHWLKSNNVKYPQNNQTLSSALGIVLSTSLTNSGRSKKGLKKALVQKEISGAHRLLFPLLHICSHLPSIFAPQKWWQPAGRSTGFTGYWWARFYHILSILQFPWIFILCGSLILKSLRPC